MFIKTFTKRQRERERAGKPDVYRYDELPKALRVQIIHILRESLGVFRTANGWGDELDSNKTWELLHDSMAREVGVFHLHKEHDDPYVQSANFLLEAPVGQALDFIELAFRFIDKIARRKPDHVRQENDMTADPDDAIEELNSRFEEHSVGFAYANGIIIRKDSEFIHAEVVCQALHLLSTEGFEGAENEFLSAHKHLRAGRIKEAMQDALKAFESTMRTIVARLKWTVDKNATAKPLLDAVFENELIPASLQSHLTALRTTLESGLPTVRNRLAGHGQGETIVLVPTYVASYCVHLAASNIVLLVEAFQAKSSRRRSNPSSN